MVTTERKISLEDAVLKSKTMSKNLYLWIIHENVLDVEVPEGYEFESTGVTWRPSGTFIVASDLPSVNGGCGIMRTPDETGDTFFNLEEMRKTYPKLFEVTGKFRTLC